MKWIFYLNNLILILDGKDLAPNASGSSGVVKPPELNTEDGCPRAPKTSR